MLASGWGRKVELIRGGSSDLGGGGGLKRLGGSSDWGEASDWGGSSELPGGREEGQGIRACPDNSP